MFEIKTEFRGWKLSDIADTNCPIYSRNMRNAAGDLAAEVCRSLQRANAEIKRQEKRILELEKLVPESIWDIDVQYKTVTHDSVKARTEVEAIDRLQKLYKTNPDVSEIVFLRAKKVY